MSHSNSTILREHWCNIALNHIGSHKTQTTIYKVLRYHGIKWKCSFKNKIYGTLKIRPQLHVGSGLRKKQISWKEDCVFPLFVLNWSPSLKSYLPGGMAAHISLPSTKGYVVIHIEALATHCSWKFFFFGNVNWL